MESKQEHSGGHFPKSGVVRRKGHFVDGTHILSLRLDVPYSDVKLELVVVYSKSCLALHEQEDLNGLDKMHSSIVTSAL